MLPNPPYSISIGEPCYTPEFIVPKLILLLLVLKFINIALVSSTLNGNTEVPVEPNPIYDVPNPTSLLEFFTAIKLYIYIYK